MESIDINGTTVRVPEAAFTDSGMWFSFSWEYNDPISGTKTAVRRASFTASQLSAGLVAAKAAGDIPQSVTLALLKDCITALALHTAKEVAEGDDG